MQPGSSTATAGEHLSCSDNNWGWGGVTTDYRQTGQWTRRYLTPRYTAQLVTSTGDQDTADRGTIEIFLPGDNRTAELGL